MDWKALFKNGSSLIVRIRLSFGSLRSWLRNLRGNVLIRGKL